MSITGKRKKVNQKLKWKPKWLDTHIHTHLRLQYHPIPRLCDPLECCEWECVTHPVRCNASINRHCEVACECEG